ncbi:MAG: hypothetical protein JW995_13065 [Melioribacteraceae bacterium]|nr:hypothetical protein [Melioribacteraceae bacterium]
MAKVELSVPVYKLALLQAYLYEIFSLENKCDMNFNHTIWYLKQNFTEKEADMIISFLRSKGVNCDCDILRKLDLSVLAAHELNFH